MAAQFKSYAVADISDASGSPSVLVDNVQIGASQYGILIGIYVTNKSVSTKYVSVVLEKNGGDTIELASSLSLPANVSFEFTEGSKIVLEEGDVLSCYTNAPDSVDALANLMINDA